MMLKRRKMSTPMPDAMMQLLSVPLGFLTGFMTGLVLPLAAIGAVVAGIRFVTGMVPFLGEVSVDDEGGRVLSLRLVPQEEVRDLYEGHKEQIGGDLVKMKAEIQAIMEEAQARQASQKEA
jgi:hypothetical protein